MLPALAQQRLDCLLSSNSPSTAARSCFCLSYRSSKAAYSASVNDSASLRPSAIASCTADSRFTPHSMLLQRQSTSSSFDGALFLSASAGGLCKATVRIPARSYVAFLLSFSVLPSAFACLFAMVLLYYIAGNMSVGIPHIFSAIYLSIFYIAGNRFLCYNNGILEKESPFLGTPERIKQYAHI